jgi:hypothetical protein
MGSLKGLEPYWWETKPKRLSEWVYEWRKRLYHENPRTAYRKDYELTRIAGTEGQLKEKLHQQRHFEQTKTEV